ncbi:MAG: MFS transporter [Firmicutes bacterium]|nr:MFS transporter [Bacillota bacterium]
MKNRTLPMYWTLEALLALSGSWFLAVINWTLYLEFHSLVVLGSLNGFMAGIGLLKGVGGSLGDRGSRHIWVSISLILRAVAAMVALLDHQFVILGTAILFYALAQTIIRPNLTASLNESVLDAQRALQNRRILGIHVLARGVGLILFMIIPVSAVVGYYTIGAIMVFTSLLWVSVPPPPEQSPQFQEESAPVRASGSVQALKRITLVYWSLPGFALLNCAMALITGTLPALTILTFHSNHWVYGSFMATALFAMTIGTVWGPHLVSLMTHARLYGVIFALPILYVVWTVEPHMWIAFITLTLLATIGGLLSALIVSYEQQHVDPHYRGSVTGITSGITAAAGAIGSLFLVIFGDFSVTHIEFLIIGILTLASGVITTALKRFYALPRLQSNERREQIHARPGL